MSISKGVDFYAYVGRASHGAPFEIKLTHPADHEKTVKANGGIVLYGFEVSEGDIGWTEHTGRVKWSVKKGSQSLLERFAEVAPLTGNLGDSNMKNMLETQSVVTKDYAISYGFYDAGSGIGPGNTLTSRHQAYVYVTRNHANWMGDLLEEEPGLKSLPFGTFALPGAHDAGMFTTILDELLKEDADTLDKLLKAVIAYNPGLQLIEGSPTQIARILVNLAVTQKDNIKTMLDLGCRFFDFRPGYFALPGAESQFGLRHQHNFVPGYPYDDFLNDVLSWLHEHPKEIVVVRLTLGFAFDFMKPKLEVIEQYLAKAIKNWTIVAGNKSDLTKPINELIAANKRLIFLNEGTGSPDDTSHLDCYNDNYNSTDLNVIKDALASITAERQASFPSTTLQVQSTAASGGRVLPSVATMSNASSPLLSTKARNDHYTYRWLLDNVPNKLQNDQLVVFLNDFVDNALTDYAKEVTRKRAKAPLYRVDANGERKVPLFSYPLDAKPPIYLVSIKPITEGDSQLSWQGHVWRDETNKICKYGCIVKNWSGRPIDFEIRVFTFKDGPENYWGDVIRGDETKRGTQFQKTFDENPPLFVSTPLPWDGGNCELSWQHFVWRDQANNLNKYGRSVTNQGKQNVTVREYVYAYKVGLKPLEWTETIGAEKSSGHHIFDVSIGDDPPFFLVTLRPTSEGNSQLIWQHHVWRDQANNLNKYGYYCTNLKDKTIDFDVYATKIQT